MIFKYYIDKVASKLQITDEIEKIAIREHVNTAIEKIFELYPELLFAETTIDTVSGENSINLPVDFWKPISFNVGNIKMDKVNRYDFSIYFPNPSGENRESPKWYDIMGINTTSTDITGTNVTDRALELVSSYVSDNTQKIAVYGEDTSGFLVNELVTITGTDKAAITKDYAKLYYCGLEDIPTNGKPVGVVDIRYTAVPTTIVGKLYVSNTVLDFTSSKSILWIHPYPDAVYTIRMRYNRMIPILQNDGDYLKYLKPAFDSYVLERAYIEYLFKDGQENLGLMLEDRWKNQINEKIEIEKRLDRQDGFETFGYEHPIYPEFNPLDRWPG